MSVVETNIAAMNEKTKLGLPKETDADELAHESLPILPDIEKPGTAVVDGDELVHAMPPPAPSPMEDPDDAVHPLPIDPPDDRE